ncbi:MAG: glycoside hydrolase family 3 N-terminal domain-containing protein [Cyclonatronaceae bacterium]
MLLSACGSSETPATADAGDTPPLYKNPDAPTEARVDDLLQRMTLEEKIGQMSQLDFSLINMEGEIRLDPERARQLIRDHHIGSFINGVAVPPEQWYEFMDGLTRIAMEESRLGIPIIFGIDHVHGASYMAESTIFPQPISMAATFDPQHARNMGSVTALEMADVGHHWNFAPTLDLGFLLGWARLYETFGEDPHMVTQMGTAYLDGYHNNEAIAPYRQASNAKHFIGYSAPFSGADRAPVQLGMQELWEKHIPPFQAAVDNGLMSMMVSSSELNGMPAHASHEILTELLREEMGFEGVILTDWDEVGKQESFHRNVANYKESTYNSVMAGVDVSMTPLSLNFNEALLELVEEGRITEERIDASVRRVLRLKFEIGLFENPFPRNDRLDRINSEENRQMNLDAARESLVLLKNEDKALPLDNPARIILAGPSADSKRNLGGGWTLAWQGGAEEQYPDDMHTIYTGLQAMYPDAEIALMDSLPEPDAAFMQQLDAADALIYAGGEEPYAEFVGNIWEDYLPAAQRDDIRLLARSETPLSLVLVQGRPRLITDIHDDIDAFIHAGLPGFQGGLAIAEVLSGAVNPSGRLPVSYPKYSGYSVNYNHKPSTTFFYHPDNQNPHDGVFRSPMLYWFGEGMSYTEFTYENLELSADSLGAGETITASVTVRNEGEMDGKLPVLWFISDLVGEVPRPVRALKHFEKIELAAGESRRVSFEIIPEEVLSYPDSEGNQMLEAGDFHLLLGDFRTPFYFEN